MSTFDPTKPALVHDSVNDRVRVWDPAWAGAYRQGAKDYGGEVYFDGLVLDGWCPAM
jgi:hypothetical protein